LLQYLVRLAHKRAEEAGPRYLYLYRTFYRLASSMHHLDFGGIAVQSDGKMMADMAPSWACLDDALVATGALFARSIITMKWQVSASRSALKAAQAQIMSRRARALARQQSSSGSGGLGPPMPRAFGGRVAIAGWQ